MFEAIECHKCHGTGGPGRRPVAVRAEGRVGASRSRRPTSPSGGRSAAAAAARRSPRGSLTGCWARPCRPSSTPSEKPEDIWHLTELHPVARAGAAGLRDAGHRGLGVGGDSRRSQRRVLEEAAAQNVPLMGQVIVDPRNFNPVDRHGVRCGPPTPTRRWSSTSPGTIPPSPSGDGKQTFPDMIALQFPTADHRGHRASVLPDGATAATPCTCCAGSRARGSARRARAGRPRWPRSPAAKPPARRFTTTASTAS